MTSNKVLFIATGFLLLTQSSCRKEKLKHTEEKLLIGTWESYQTFNGFNWSIANSHSKLVIYQDGTFTYIENGDGKKGRYRIARLKLANSYNQSPQFSCLFKTRIKNTIFSHGDEFENFVAISYTNGYFNNSGDFVQKERIHLMRSIESPDGGNMIFIRK